MVRINLIQLSLLVQGVHQQKNFALQMVVNKSNRGKVLKLIKRATQEDDNTALKTIYTDLLTLGTEQPDVHSKNTQMEGNCEIKGLKQAFEVLLGKETYKQYCSSAVLR